MQKRPCGRSALFWTGQNQWVWPEDTENYNAWGSNWQLERLTDVFVTLQHAVLNCSSHWVEDPLYFSKEVWEHLQPR